MFPPGRVLRCLLLLGAAGLTVPVCAAPPLWLGSVINAIVERIVYGEPSTATIHFSGQPPMRRLPPEAEVGILSPPEGRLVRLDGQERMLSPGAQIRDLHNRIVLPASLREDTRVLYLADAQQQLHRLWIITDQELEAVREYKRLLQEQQERQEGGVSADGPAVRPVRQP